MTRLRPLGLGTHIFVTDPDAAVAFYREAFGAAELIRHRLPDGRVLFVELAVGPDKLLISEEIRELNALSPATLGGSPVLLLLELDDVDGTFDQAVQRGRHSGDADRRDVLGRAVRDRPGSLRPPLGTLHPARAARSGRGCRAGTRGANRQRMGRSLRSGMRPGYGRVGQAWPVSRSQAAARASCSAGSRRCSGTGTGRRSRQYGARPRSASVAQ